MESPRVHTILVNRYKTNHKRYLLVSIFRNIHHPFEVAIQNLSNTFILWEARNSMLSSLLCNRVIDSPLAFLIWEHDEKRLQRA